MIVFNTYFKILKSRIRSIGVYIAVFLVMVFTLGNLGSANEVSDFQEKRFKVSVWNQDEQTELVGGLTAYLEQKGDFVTLNPDMESISDALFFRQVDYVVIIPAGFSKAFFTDNSISLEKIEVEASYSSAYMNKLINQYLSTYLAYYKAEDQLTQTEIRELTETTLLEEIAVKMEFNQDKKERIKQMASYFNFTGYAIMGVLISGVSIGMYSFTNKNIRKRNACSPMSSLNLNMQFVAANFLFMLFVYLISLVPVMIIYREQVFTVAGGLMLLNLFCLNLFSMLIGNLLSEVVKSRAAQSSATTSLTLGLAFLSGMFVPQKQLSEFMKKLGSFTPTFWYVKANDQLTELSGCTYESLKSIFGAMGIQVGFAIALLSIILVIRKQKVIAENT